MSTERLLTILLIVVAFLLAGAAMRLAGTPPDHADRAARGDTVRLLTLVALGLALGVVRERLAFGGPPFWILSGLLALLGAWALILAWGLIGAYLRSPGSRKTS